MKAQSALEYLMTYGWAILIVIIVGAALYALGVFNPGTFTGHKSTGFSATQMEDFKFDDSGNMSLRIGNRYGRTINITGVHAEYTTTKSGDATGVCTPPACITCIDLNLGPNSECDETFSIESPGEPQGTAYNIKVSINFTDSKTGLAHTDYGTVLGSVEPA